jgi:predicted Rossmann fold flavoprotein
VTREIADRMSDVLDVLVLGGGAAGLFAATEAARRGARVALLERNKKPGVKVLASGGSRCNVTSVLPVHVLAKHFGKPGGRFLGHAFKALPPTAIVQLLHDEGVETYEEKFDKIFPVSNKATDVLAAFMRRFDASGATLRCESRIEVVQRDEDGTFVVHAGADRLRAKSVVLAVGGQSYPGTGSTGDGYAIAARLGHTIVPPRPALVPLLVDEAWVKELTGIAFQDVEVKLVDAAGAVLAQRRRPLLFTHFGLSGPAAMDVSREVSARDEPTTLVVDFLPDFDAKDLERELDRSIAVMPTHALHRAIEGEFPQRFLTILFATRGVSGDQRCAEVSRSSRRIVVELLKGTRIPIAGTQNFTRAEVTAGGVTLDEVDPLTMESKRVRGFYVCGEVLDVDGPIGGFNFQSAFSTGFVAGGSAALR